MIEIGTRVKIATIFGDFDGTVQSVKQTPENVTMYMVLVDASETLTTEQDRLMGSTTVTPLTET